MARTLHKWDLSPARARQLQESLRQRVIRTDSFKPLRTVAGCDLSFVKHSSIAYGGIILYSYPELEELERVWVKKQLSFPYVPGLLSFREGPVLLAAFRKLKRKPSLVIFDAQGYAHPRRFGLACHLGLWLDVPSIGCAKSRLCGEHGGPGKKKGSFAPLMAGKEQIGAVLRTRDKVKPIFVSTGHRVSLRTAVSVTLKCCDGYRVPKPTREADHFVAQVKRES